MKRASKNSATPFERCCAAPVLGVGLGIDVFDEDTDFRALIKDWRHTFDFLEVYTRGDWLHCEAALKVVPKSVPRTYHHEGLDPVAPKLCPAPTIDGCAKNMLLLDAPWSVEELAVRHIDGRYTDFFFPAILSKDAVKHTVKNLRALQARLPRPILPENAPYEFAIGDMHLLDFLREVAHGAEMGCVLDLGHLYSYQLCVGKGESPLHGIERMDLSRIIEVHLAGARLEASPDGRPIYRDVHGGGPIPKQSLYMLGALLPQLPNLKAITIEVESASPERCAEQLSQVREVVARARPQWQAAQPAPKARRSARAPKTNDLEPMGAT